MDSNIPTNPAYGVCISQLVRYARICTYKVDFMNRLHHVSDVSLDFVSGNIRTLGKTKLTVSLGTVH